MKKKFAIFILLVVLLVGGASFFFSRRGPQQSPPVSPTPTPTPSPTGWKTIVPGVSTQAELVQKLGPPKETTQTQEGTVYGYPSLNNQYWTNDILVTNGSVSFIRERIFKPAETSLSALTKKHQEPPIQLFGPDSNGGTDLFAYPPRGTAYLANSYQDTVYQVWHFSPMSLAEFLASPVGDDYRTTLEEAGDPH